MPVTIRDVAREASVSIKTVSRVVNHQGEIKDETRQCVLNAIDKLGYRPSKVARALVTNRTDTIGLIIDDITNPYFSEAARGVLDVTQEEGYDVFLYTTGDMTASVKHALFSLIDHNVDGAIVFSSRSNLDWLDEIRNSGLPIVLVNTDIEPEKGIGVVNTEIQEGANLGVTYLIE